MLVLLAGARWVTRPFQQRWLVVACVEGNIERVRYLLLSGADANARTDKGITPLMFTSGWSNPFLMGAAEPEKSPTLADLASDVYDDYPTIAELLLKHGADVNARTDEGYTALYWASQVGHEDLVRVLIEHGADVNANTISDETPLQAAQARRELSPEKFDRVISLLKEAGQRNTTPP